MSYGLKKTLQMYTVKIESGLGYKSSQVRVQDQQKWTEVDSSPSADSSATSLGCSVFSKYEWVKWVSPIKSVFRITHSVL